MIWNCLMRSAAWDVPRWLCERHLAARREQRDAAGNPRWLGVDQIVAIDGGCSDCESERQGAPEYMTPTVAFVATAPGSRLLTPAELALIEMPSLLHPPPAKRSRRAETRPADRKQRDQRSRHP